MWDEEAKGQRRHSVSTKDPALTMASMKADGVRVMRATREAGASHQGLFVSTLWLPAMTCNPQERGGLGKTGDNRIERDWEARG